MNMAKLEIQQSHIRLDWDVQRPTYSFEPGHAEVEITQQPAEMILNRTPIKLTIDQTQCWADMDLKHISQRIAEAAADGKQSILAYIERVTLEGEQLGAIENTGNTIRQIAANNAYPKSPQFKYGNVPGNFSLRFAFTPGELNMDWKIGGATIDVRSVPFHHSYEKGSITYSIPQRNEMHFQVVGGKLDIGY